VFVKGIILQKNSIEMEELKEEEIREMKVWEKRHRWGKITAGILLVVIGKLFLLRELGVEIPYWIFSWKMLLVGIGLIIGVSHGFRSAGWLIPVLVGASFLMIDLYPEMNIKSIIWPVLLIILGLFIIFKPRRKHHQWKHWKHHRLRRYARDYGKYGEDYGKYAKEYSFGEYEESSDEDKIELVSFMAGTKKSIMSKQFKGGEVTNVFGGTELNLMQADFEGKITLELTQVFGGTRLIVPSNWEIQSTSFVTVLGSVEDKRTLKPPTGDEPSKVLILTGTAVFGGIEIRSY
jgi:predicted membrane protein